MKKIILLLLFFSGIVNSQTVNIPDTTFRQLLLVGSAGSTGRLYAFDSLGNPITVDSNSNGAIELTEAAAVYKLTIGYQGFLGSGVTPVYSLEGISAFTNIQDLVIEGIGTINMDFSSNSLLINLTVSFCGELTDINISGTSLKNLIIDGSKKLENLNVTNTASLETLVIKYGNSDGDVNTKLTNINVSNSPMLKILDCQKSKALENLDLTNNPALEQLNISNCKFNTINLVNNIALQTLNCSNNLFTSLNVSNNVALFDLRCSNNLLTILDLSQNANLNQLSCASNSLTGLDLSVCTNLSFLDCSINQLENLIISSSIITTLNFSLNKISALNFNNFTNLGILKCASNSLTSLDISKCPNIWLLHIGSNPIESIYLKSGSLKNFYDDTEGTVDDVSNLPLLKYICFDKGEESFVNRIVQDSGSPEAVFNSYCTEEPGGNYNTITGKVSFDNNNNGCDATDKLVGAAKIVINTPSNSKVYAFTDSNGVYTYYTQEIGNFTISTAIENPNSFNVVPVSTAVTFTENNFTVANNDFCITANGTNPAVEITIIPVEKGTPGGKATYQMYCKNTGNQVLNGTVTINYNSLLQFSNSLPLPAINNGSNQLQWNFSNLSPLEVRILELDFIVDANANPGVFDVNLNQFINADTLIIDALLVTYGVNSISDSATYSSIPVTFEEQNYIANLPKNLIPTNSIGYYLYYGIVYGRNDINSVGHLVIPINLNPSQYDLDSIQIINPMSNMIFVMSSFNNSLIIPPTFSVRPPRPSSGQGLQNLRQQQPIILNQGVIGLKIKTLPTVPVNSSICIDAEVVYDQDEPIQLNEICSVYSSTLSNDRGLESDRSVAVFPNPVNTNLTITAQNTIERYELYDVYGVVKTNEKSNKKETSIDLNDFKPGVYFLKIVTNKGIKIEKIIKQ
jgi:hypothetical protein